MRTRSLTAADNWQGFLDSVEQLRDQLIRLRRKYRAHPEFAAVSALVEDAKTDLGRIVLSQIPTKDLIRFLWERKAQRKAQRKGQQGYAGEQAASHE